MVVVEVTPALDEHTSLVDVSEPLAIEAFIAQLAVEAFDVAILPWAIGKCRKSQQIVMIPEWRRAGEAVLLVRGSLGSVLDDPHQVLHDECVFRSWKAAVRADAGPGFRMMPGRL